ncbi:GcrA cell cycle regulator [Rhizobium leguminosarum]|uniref:GcrA family cell cycle regulator n=1 Tax=Rhizobium leguminosarum TaxID=384 RepID=UPI001C987780|nr:GcrA family cell cycle regulator [Rhizobium leguminosarum]MBY5706979.1 GcrA cell cycle regulator [Rhizobium leguminosarum]
MRPNDDGRPYGGTSNWTDERVDVLKRLWSEGLSASQIAQSLGGVSRNNVIGKVHRLSLPGRAKAGDSLASQRAAVRAERHQRGPDVEATEYRPAVNVVVPIARRLSLGQLTEQTCHWPVGDPLEVDFHFCGLEVSPSGPYCPYHSKLAYQPAKGARDRKIGSTDNLDALAENVTTTRFDPRMLSPLATVTTLKASAKK